MFIEFEETPNPNTLKFLPGRPVMAQGSVAFETAADAERSPLAKRLYEITGVAGVFLGADFVSVSKTDEAVWEDLKPAALTAIMEHFTSGQPVMSGDIQASAARRMTARLSGRLRKYWIRGSNLPSQWTVAISNLLISATGWFTCVWKVPVPVAPARR